MLKTKLDAQALARLRAMIEGLKKPIDEKTAREVGSGVVEEMKRLITRGISPVRGNGLIARLPRYKNPKKYPGDKKAKTPVNLTLSGDFLDSLRYTIKPSRSGYATEVGYDDPISRLKEKGHREGSNGQPKRPTIPAVSQGEAFAASVERLINKVFRKRISELLRRRS